MLKCLGGVHTHRNDTDDGTGSQQRVHPLQKEIGRQTVMYIAVELHGKAWLYYTWGHALACWSRRCQRCLWGSHLAQSLSWAEPRPVSSVSFSACWGLLCYTESGSDREMDHTVTKDKWGTGEWSGHIQVWAVAVQPLAQVISVYYNLMICFAQREALVLSYLATLMVTNLRKTSAILKEEL